MKKLLYSLLFLIATNSFCQSLSREQLTAAADRYIECIATLGEATELDQVMLTEKLTLICDPSVQKSLNHKVICSDREALIAQLSEAKRSFAFWNTGLGQLTVDETNNKAVIFYQIKALDSDRKVIKNLIVMKILTYEESGQLASIVEVFNTPKQTPFTLAPHAASLSREELLAATGRYTESIARLGREAFDTDEWLSETLGLLCSENVHKIMNNDIACTSKDGLVKQLFDARTTYGSWDMNVTQTIIDEAQNQAVIYYLMSVGDLTFVVMKILTYDDTGKICRIEEVFNAADTTDFTK